MQKGAKEIFPEKYLSDANHPAIAVVYGIDYFISSYIQELIFYAIILSSQKSNYNKHHILRILTRLQTAQIYLLNKKGGEMPGLSKSYIKFFILLIVLVFAAQSCKGGGKSKSGSEVKPLPGGEFNKFIPKDSGDFKIVFTQEKPGLAQAKLKKTGKDLATLTISDIAANPKAANKFKNSSKTIEGYPAVGSGAKGTAILVENRFQVQVRSQGDDFTEKDREEWIKKFDIKGLAKLKDKDK
jgi:hypothetical protein